MKEFNEWVNQEASQTSSKKIKLSSSNPFDLYERSEYWAYADYKYMIELLKSKENLIADNVNKNSNIKIGIQALFRSFTKVY